REEDARGSHGLRGVRIDHEFDAESGRVRAIERDTYGEIVIAERPADIDPAIAAQLLAAEYLRRPRSERDEQLLRRLRFAGVHTDVDALTREAAVGKRSIDDLDVRAALAWNVTRDLERLAPERLPVPSGRTAPLWYEEDGSVTASVKLQELFGLAET